MFERLFCAVAGHRYTVVRLMPMYERKIECARCGKAWAMHDGLRIILPWDDEFEALYAPGGPLHPGETKPKEGETA